MLIPFYKYQGAGNDFILINNINQMLLLTKEQIENLCNRHYGIGADGLILLAPHTTAPFEMIYYNADGGLGSMCGNGGRCAVAFAQYLKLIDTSCTFKAYDGMHQAKVWPNDKLNNTVTLQMADVTEISKTNMGYVLNTGSPHVVVFVDDVDTIDIVKNGAAIRYDSAFEPGGTNVNFVTIGSDFIRVRTYERGVESETQSCGTGVTASAIAYAYENNLNQKKVNVSTLGGWLTVDFNIIDNKATGVFLTGQTTQVFNGHIDL
jgi:diaminopimelate epimerase